jgi:anti-sigma-K factor RskA
MTPKDDAIRSAEHALGLLDGPALRAFETRLKREADLRREVAFWEDRLAPALFAAGEAPPPAHLLTRVEASLFGRPEARAAVAAPFPWKKFVLGLVAVKLVLLTAWYVAGTTRGPADPTPGRGAQELILR